MTGILRGQTLTALAQALATGRTSSVELVEQALAAIDAPGGEGSRAFLFVDRDGARAAAEEADRRRASRGQRGNATPFLGIPISVKDLFDVAGQVTRAGSRLLEGSAPAKADATAVARLRAAGFVLLGRTNMTEFAYSGLGLNPHYGTPLNPWRRNEERIPGGSSSGAAVAVADGMAAAGIGTDTGGSCRIPAAMCGIVGYKPTAPSVPRDGVLPLSESLDSVGALANSVACCATLHRIMAGMDGAAAVHTELPTPPTATLGILRTHVMDDVEPAVATAFERAVRRLAARGFKLLDIALPGLDRLPEINAKGGLAAAEAFAWHRQHLASHAERYDPRVRARIARGAEQSAADYLDGKRARRELIDEAQAALQGCAAIVYPTVPMLAPRLADCAEDDEYARLNLLALRNPAVANVLDGCALSLPIHDPGDPPVGMNLLCLAYQDEPLLALGRGVERALTN